MSEDNYNIYSNQKLKSIISDDGVIEGDIVIRGNEIKSLGALKKINGNHGIDSNSLSNLGELNYVKNDKNYSFVFAFHPNGANDFQGIPGKNKKKKLKVAEKQAIKACNKKAKQKGCMVFAINAQIVWNWDDIPEAYYTLINVMDTFYYIDYLLLDRLLYLLSLQ